MLLKEMSLSKESAKSQKELKMYILPKRQTTML